MITADKIISIVADYFHVDKNYIKTSKRKLEIIKIKHLAIYFVKKDAKLSLRETGDYFIGKNKILDHASVLHAINSVNNQYDTNIYYRKQFDDIEKLIEKEKESIAHLEKMMVDEVYQETDFYTNLEINNNFETIINFKN